MKKKFLWNLMILLVLSSLVLVGCPDDSPVRPPDDGEDQSPTPVFVETEFRLLEANPSVAHFDLTEPSPGIWRVFSQAAGGAPITAQVTVTYTLITEPALIPRVTLTRVGGGALTAGAYWVSVQRAGMTESERVMLTVIAFDESVPLPPSSLVLTFDQPPIVGEPPLPNQAISNPGTELIWNANVVWQTENNQPVAGNFEPDSIYKAVITFTALGLFTFDEIVLEDFENANNFTGAAFEWNLATLTLTITFPRTPDNISVPDRVELRVFDNGGTPEIAMRDLNDQNFAVTTGEHISIVDVNGRNVMNWDIGTPGTDPNFDNGNIINMNGQIISSFIGNDNDWTMEMFIRETNFTQGGNVDVLMFHTGPNRIGQVTVGGETLGREAPGTFRIESQAWFYVTIPGGATGRFAARPSVNAGDWGHLFIVRNSETERLDVFRNGIHLDGAQQLGWASAAESFNNIDYAAVGPFRGANSQLYQFAIQEGALTATQVAARRQNVLHTLFQLEGFETNDIIFNLQGGNWDGNTQAVTIRVPVGIGMNVYQLLPANPVLAGSNFYGWNTQANGEGIFVTGDTVITDDITELFAIWVSEISVTFDSYIGRFPDNTTTREAILPVDSPSFTSNPAQWPVDPVLPGFVFDGWWTLRSSDPINDVGIGSGLSVLNFGTQLTQATTLTANMTVFARWRLDENLNIHRIEYRINNEDQLEARVYGASNVRLLTIPVNVTNNAFEVQQPNIVNVNGIRVIQNQRIDLGPIFTSLFGNNEWTLEYYMRASNTDNPARFGRQPGTGNLWGGILIEGGTGANSHNHFFITRPQDGGTGARRTQWRVLMNPDAGWVHVAQVLRPGVNELFTYTNGMFRQGSNGVNHREHFSGVRMRHLYYNWIGGNGFWVHGVTMHNTAFDEVNFTNVGVHETLDLLREGVPPLPPND